MALIVQDASADPRRIAFPNDYLEKFTFYSTHNRPDNGQVRYLFANQKAMEKRAVPTVTTAEARMAAAGNADRGKQLFARCGNCHAADPSGKHKVGPNLSGVVGRAVAAAPGYAYSADLKKLGQNWDDVRLDAWLAGPQSLAKGAKLVFPGFVKAQDRADVITFLKTVK